MIQFTPTTDDQFDIESDIDFADILRQADNLMDKGAVEQACQLRLDTAVAALEAIDASDLDPLELDMENKENQPFVDVIYSCGLDHYYICDFETAAAMFETALEIDPEDHFGALKPLAYCYVALKEDEALKEITDLISFSKLEQEFFNWFTKILNDKPTTIAPLLKTELSRENSELRAEVSHLIANFPKLQTLLL